MKIMEISSVLAAAPIVLLMRKSVTTFEEVGKKEIHDSDIESI